MTGKIECDKGVNKEREKSFEKTKLDVDQMLKDNEKHNKIEKKYDNLHLKSKTKGKSPLNINQSKS